MDIKDSGKLMRPVFQHLNEQFVLKQGSLQLIGFNNFQRIILRCEASAGLP